MCCLIVSKDGSTITEREFFTAVSNNPDGIGIVYSNGEDYKMKKFLDEELAYEYYLNIPVGYRYALHFRNASLGEVTIDNVHPFNVGNDTVMFHNGTIYADELYHATKSDTRMLASMLQKYKQPIIGNTILVNLLSKYANPSKLVFFRKDGAYQIVNWHLGVYEKARDIWFSNNGYREKDFYGKKTNIYSPGFAGGWVV